MGVKDLWRLVEKASRREKGISYRYRVKMGNYAGKTIAFDISQFMHQGMRKVRRSGRDIIGTDNKPITHLHVLFYKIISFINHGIKPIIVFDGKAPKGVKEDTLKQRWADNKKNEAAYKKACTGDDAEEKNRLFSSITRFTFEMRDECKQLLDLMGIPYVQSPGEADPQCAILTRSESVYAAASNDSDLLVFGATKLIRFMSSNATFEEISLKGLRKVLKLEVDLFSLSDDEIVSLADTLGAEDEILRHLDIMSHNRLIDLCILLGISDIPILPGMTSELALCLVQRYYTLEEIIDQINNGTSKIQLPKELKVPDGYLETIGLKRQYFRGEYGEVTNPDTVDFGQKDINMKELYAYLIALGFKQTETTEVLGKLNMKQNKSSSDFPSSFGSYRRRFPQAYRKHRTRT